MYMANGGACGVTSAAHKYLPGGALVSIGTPEREWP